MEWNAVMSCEHSCKNWYTAKIVNKANQKQQKTIKMWMKMIMEHIIVSLLKAKTKKIHKLGCLTTEI